MHFVTGRGADHERFPLHLGHSALARSRARVALRVRVQVIFVKVEVVRWTSELCGGRVYSVDVVIQLGGVLGNILRVTEFSIVFFWPLVLSSHLYHHHCLLLLQGDVLNGFDWQSQLWHLNGKQIV